MRDIEVSRDLTLNEFKEIVCDFIDSTHGVDYLRLREKNHNGFFGKIFREGAKTLK